MAGFAVRHDAVEPVHLPAVISDLKSRCRCSRSYGVVSPHPAKRDAPPLAIEAAAGGIGARQSVEEVVGLRFS